MDIMGINKNYMLPTDPTPTVRSSATNMNLNISSEYRSGYAANTVITLNRSIISHKSTKAIKENQNISAIHHQVLIRQSLQKQPQQPQQIVQSICFTSVKQASKKQDIQYQVAQQLLSKPLNKRKSLKRSFSIANCSKTSYSTNLNILM
ncbi:hypothetical protein Glove_33g282 [Diversispora epigaea]|uniref:Uncharacterized protein n=1 Tax=Diversispora epigaea TaxID=1348612 RepID=A0A397JGR1_9GLOM|nr:hypothetical protein Glove_33g282 [Diversispora epigaea]